VYNEEVFASLDWVLAEAANRNLKIILPIEVCLFTSCHLCWCCCCSFNKFVSFVALNEHDMAVAGLLALHGQVCELVVDS
jgi:hypothetical protein